MYGMTAKSHTDSLSQDLGVAVGVFDPQTGDVLQAVALALGPDNQSK
jgi:hypothetical protein